MNLGWKDWIRKKLAGQSSYAAVGIEYRSEGINASLFTLENGRLTWKKFKFFPAKDWKEELAKWIKDHDAQNTPCYVSLSSGLYQLRQVDRPNVDDQEVVQALKWSVGDIFGTLEEQVIDCFDIPAQAFGNEKVNLVAVPKSMVESIIDGISQADLKLMVITIEELSLCELLGFNDEAQMLITQGHGGKVTLMIVRNGKLYFSRRIRGYGELDSLGPNLQEHNLVENLALEIQRSMDYFESQLKQANVNKLVVCVDTPHLDALKQALQNNVDADVEWLVPPIDMDSHSLMPESIVSVSAALASQSKLQGEVV